MPSRPITSGPSRFSANSLDIRRRMLGENHPDFAASVNNLAGVTGRRRTTRAEPLLRQVVEIEKRSRGEKHPEYATSLSNLASLHFTLKATTPAPSRCCGRRRLFSASSLPTRPRCSGAATVGHAAICALVPRQLCRRSPRMARAWKRPTVICLPGRGWSTAAATDAKQSAPTRNSACLHAVAADRDATGPTGLGLA